MKRNHYNDKTIIFIYVLISIALLISLLREPKEISGLENRNLNKFGVVNISSYVKKDFQDNTEKAINDQIIGAETIKTILQSKLSFSNRLASNRFLCKNNYIKIGSGEGKDYYNYNCEKVLIYGRVKDISNYKEMVKKTLSSYKRITEEYDTYFYYIPTSYTFDFKVNKEEISILDIIDPKWKVDYLKYDNFKEYKEFFFSSDHHWNYKGSYQGYKDIHKLLGLHDSPLRPEKECSFPVEFYGSSARILRLKDYHDQFTVYQYNLPPHSSYVPMYNIEYGNQQKYFNNEYNTEIYINHYGEYYGYDYDEVVFDYNQKEKDNLLIISNSFSNAINELIASHYNKTFIIDLRHRKEFNIMDYVKKNKISKILFIMDSENYFNSGAFILREEY